jgi:hypothetical protein
VGVGLFTSVFVVGAGLLALWIDVRFPRLAPGSFSRRMLLAACAVLGLQLTPVLSGSAVAVYAGLFAIMLPVFVTALLAALWMLRSLRDAQLSN